jgi:hypothetical protein
MRSLLIAVAFLCVAATTSAQYPLAPYQPYRTVAPLTPPLSAPMVPLPTYSTPLPRYPSPPAIVAQDGQFLGVLSSNKYDPLSVSNPYGTYGSKYSPTSINNPYSTYGSKYSPLSPTNPYATTPPLLISPSPYRIW